ncbi:hypothetical protein [Pantoea cypripedii]|uniref:Uncharacterized protein n=1 Tax=Pantoea cypripedii TaxID=55209 RepID=A0A1X1EK46_PANCY|nr:hypothetical protein [Pantoea cypripedii]MBP2198895.1 hypothetical protein [Pantoea cypripedii]ORM89338.1 hypothetical protein HA50_22080 [Pantoea cypripedii]
MAFIMTGAASCGGFIKNSYQHLLQPLPLPALLIGFCPPLLRRNVLRIYHSIFLNYFSKSLSFYSPLRRSILSHIGAQHPTH